MKFLDFKGAQTLIRLLKGYTDEKVASLDFSLFKIVRELPVTGISENKIYLVPSEKTGVKNIYTEYVYTGSDWEKLGEVHSDVDLAGYVNAVATSGTNMTLSASISGNRMTITGSVPVATNAAAGVVKVTAGNGLSLSSGVLAMGVGSAKAAGALQVTEGNGLSVAAGKISIQVATGSAAGAMSATDKSKLDSLEKMAAITEADITKLFD